MGSVKRVLMVSFRAPISLSSIEPELNEYEKDKQGKRRFSEERSNMGPVIDVVNAFSTRSSLEASGNQPFVFRDLASSVSGEAEDESTQTFQFTYVGIVGNGEPSEEMQQTCKEKNIEPVIITRDEMVQGYDFCKGMLWPLLHYKMNTQEFNYVQWGSYQRLNQAFADQIAKIYKPGDLIWVHDYHLFLLPSLLRERIEDPSLKIGFFLHSPFPSSELYRVLPVRTEILLGMFGANLIGFQTNDYVHHFLSSCTAILGIDNDPEGFEHNGRFILIKVFPVGVDSERFLSSLDSSEVKERAQEMLKMFTGKKIIVGCDRLDAVKGLVQKLLIFEDFLTRYPQHRDDTLLVQVCQAPLSESEEIVNLQIKINELVGRINGKFSTVGFNPIYYQCKTITHPELVAIYSIADACLLTPIRDGMNLTSQEFVICQRDKHSPLILSEFAGAALYLSGAILVNPWDIGAVSDALHKSLSLSEEEKLSMYQRNSEVCLAHSAKFWGKCFLQELSDLPTKPWEAPRLEPSKVARAYKKAKGKRVFLLDYDGTLTPIVKRPELAKPSKEILKILKKLASEPNNLIYVISGRDRETLQSWLRDIPIGLSCEHGCFFKAPHSEMWENRVAGIDLSWKNVILGIFQDFTERTPGSMIENKTINVTWHYRNADPNFASCQQKELLVHLNTVSSKLPIEILVGKKMIEVRPQGVNKGSIVKDILKSVPGVVEFVLCMGDDKTDEDMFTALKSMEPPIESSGKWFNVVVGKKNTIASFYLPTQRHVNALLHNLAFNSPEYYKSSSSSSLKKNSG